MKIEIECIGEMCAKCEKLELKQQPTEDYRFKGWACKNVGHCRYIVDEYTREINERIRINEQP